MPPARAGIFINQIMKDYRTGNGYDVHALKNGLKMWLCGIQIPCEMGFVAHSDGDVAIPAPTLRPPLDTLRKTHAEVMGVEIDRVSVKATTTERLGFVGRGEGCEVWASASIFKEL